MIRIFNCLTCSKVVKISESKNRIGTSKFCSKHCHGKNSEFWGRASYEQKINRLKKFFEKYVVKKEGCWDWIGPVLCGRGRLVFNKKAMQAHRASWLINKGEIPEGKYVCHTCDNIICTNPEHLFLGTPSENTIDMVLKGRKKNMRLSKDDIPVIRDKIKIGIRGKDIAKEYGVSEMTISDIKIGRSWTHI